MKTNGYQTKATKIEATSCVPRCSFIAAFFLIAFSSCLPTKADPGGSENGGCAASGKQLPLPRLM
jgi:hypothetical protein